MSAAPTGYSARLTSETSEEAIGGVITAVRTISWELTWQPVAGAADYLVFFHTSEGASQQPAIVVSPCFRLSVARLLADDASDPSAHVAMAAAHLTVSVAARFPGGTLGPGSPLFPVGLTEIASATL